MPTTFDNGFYGGNPVVQGPGEHHNTDPITGAREIMQADYLNLIEDAIEVTQDAVNTAETAFNTLLVGLRTVASIEEINALASGITTL